MIRQMRFGRSIPLPLIAQIKHELRLMNTVDAVAAVAGQPMTSEKISTLAKQLRGQPRDFIMMRRDVISKLSFVVLGVIILLIGHESVRLGYYDYSAFTAIGTLNVIAMLVFMIIV